MPYRRWWARRAHDFAHPRALSSAPLPTLHCAFMCASVHVLLIAAALLEIGDERNRLVGRAHPEGRHHVDEGALHVPRHVLGVAADIDVGAFREPRPQVAADLAHAVLHVELLLAVARPGEREASEHA